MNPLEKALKAEQEAKAKQEKTEERRGERRNTRERIINISESESSDINPKAQVKSKTKTKSNKRGREKIHHGRRRIYGYDTSNTSQDTTMNSRIYGQTGDVNNGVNTIADMFGVKPGENRFNTGNSMIPNQNFYNAPQFPTQTQMPFSYNQPMYTTQGQQLQQNVGFSINNPDENQMMQNYLALSNNSKNQVDPNAIAALVQQQQQQFSNPVAGQYNMANQMNPMSNIPLNMNLPPQGQVDPRLTSGINQTGGAQNPFFFR